MLMCCHPALSPGTAIPLTLRAVGGLTTREIAAAFLVPEPTMAQRISRAKAKLKGFGEPFTLPRRRGGSERLRSVLHVLYLIFNEGYAASDGPDLARTDLSGEAVRLARGVHAAMPQDAEVTGLLALMLLTDARRPARTGPGGELVPLEAQDRARWDRAAHHRGPDAAHRRPAPGRAGRVPATGGHRRAARPGRQPCEHRLAADPGPVRPAGGADRQPDGHAEPCRRHGDGHGPGRGPGAARRPGGRLGDHHRLHSVRAHLLEQAGDTGGAAAEFQAAAARTTNLRERDYLVTQAARLAAGPP